MTAHPPFRKVLDGVATREQMIQLFSRHKDTPGIDPLSGTPYSGEWFEIAASEYHFMLDLLPPLFMRTGMFGMSEYKTGNVTSVFFAIRIRGRERWFHGFCDLTDRQSPDKMRAAIIAHETGASDSMTGAEKLEAIWNMTRQGPARTPMAYSTYTASLGAPDRRQYRRTPPGALTVADLVRPGDTVATSYSTGGVVIEVEEHFYAAPTGETLSHFTIVYVPPDRTTRYRDSDRRWINECVAIGDRILMLFEANTDEVFVLSRARPSQPPRSRTIPADGPFQSRVRALAAEGDRGSREGQGDYRRTPRPAG